MSLSTRINRFEADGKPNGPCPDEHLATVIVRAGEDIPEGAATCARCGRVHALELEAVIVGSRAEAEAERQRAGSELIR